MSKTFEQLDVLKKKIELLEKNQQIEILRIIHNAQSNIINENKNGIYINMSSLSDDIIDELQNYLTYINTQEKDLIVNENIMNLCKPDTVFMHCLPANLGEEVSEYIFRSKHSIVWKQAENRMYIQKNILKWLNL